MKKVEELTAYEVIERKQSSDLNSLCYLLRHKKTGARIVLLSNDDNNKVFYIGFRTPPTDSTGVAHIIEHTVLCGSEKYPAKDPFIELAKGSLNTFLNAMTYPDKTVYPVASCNDKDFANLMDVYLDAVFHPNIYKEEKIFRQEGWHYQLETPEDTLQYNGVVYNEMKGAFSSPDDVLDREIMNALYPDTSYGVESGGDPDFIPDLTYKDFLDFHSKYYHPSNSYIYLYGDMDMAERLTYLDEEYLSKYDALAIDSTIKAQSPFGETRYLEKEYPIMDNESEKDNTYLTYNVALEDNLDPEKYVALQILDYALCSAPGAPIKQALIDLGIGKDVYSTYENGIKQPFFSIVAKSANEEQQTQFVETIEKILQDVVQKGIDKKAFLAGLNYYEFRYREADFGSHPKGLLWGLQMFDSWLYDDSKPFLHLEANATYAALKKYVDTGYFEKLIQEAILENTHKVVLMVKPVKGLTAKKEKALLDKLEQKKQSLSDEEIQAIVEETEALRIYQEEPSSKEDLEKIPHLTREDIRKEAEPYVLEERSVEDTTILFHPIFTNQIGYIKLLFDMQDIPSEYVPYIGLLKAFIGLLDTEHYSYGELFNEIHFQTGGIGAGVNTYPNAVQRQQFKTMFEVKVKALYEKQDKAFELIRELLVDTKYDNYKRLKELIDETKSHAQAHMISAGHSVAAIRALSYISPTAAVGEQISGVAFYRFLEELDTEFEAKKEQIATALADLAKHIFRADNLLVDYTGTEEGYEAIPGHVAELKKALFVVQDRGEGIPFVAHRKNEGFMTAGQVQYVCRAGNYREKGLPYTGALRVLKTIMGYEYLWIQVRVKGGAYGCMCSFGKSGDSFFVSYRDPHLAQTVKTYEQIADFVEQFEADEETMTKYIIGTISELDTPFTPASKGTYSLTGYLTGCTYEMMQKERDEILHIDVEAVRKLADYMKAIMESDCFCVVGTEEKIQNKKEMFRQIEYLFN